MKRAALMLIWLLAMPLAHAEPAQTTRATDVLAQAQSDAARVVALKANARLELLRRAGAWGEVKTAQGLTGWVRMRHLKVATPAAANPANALNSLLNSGRTASNATVTTGVRGLQEEDLHRAQPNVEELKKMQNNAVSREAAQAFAQRTRLSPVRLDYLEDAAPPANNNEPASGSGVMGG